MKPVSLIIAGLMMVFAASTSVMAQEVIIKGTVVQAEDVCGVMSEEAIYIIPCSQVDDFDGKLVNIVGMVTEVGDIQTIDATSVQTIE
ncbi:MAG: hypothetical protein HQK61_12615 [Desulfamplus sp.]|nr:hypothetical protein [Desulfamplus sp.]